MTTPPDTRSTAVDKRWTYCPECGSTEIRHAEGDHKQCACCLQEWFADIDYTDVVRTNLGNRMQLRSSLTARDELLKRASQLSIKDCHCKYCQKWLADVAAILAKETTRG